MPTSAAIESTLEVVWAVSDRARTHAALSRADHVFVRDTVPVSLASFPQLQLPKTIRHPGGFTVSGAPVGTFLRCALLIAGQKSLGRRFAGHAFYEHVERDLAFNIMRSHFHHGYPKGTHCCVQCTLAVYPVLAAGAIRYFDCAPLAVDVRQLVRTRQWRFVQPANASMVRWSLGDEE
jgi:hypothetical protein